MVGPGSDKTVALKEEKEFFLSLLCEDTVRRQLSVNQKKCFCKTPNQFHLDIGLL